MNSRRLAIVIVVLVMAVGVSTFALASVAPPKPPSDPMLTCGLVTEPFCMPSTRSLQRLTPESGFETASR